jgi:hypothetical protein
MPSKKKDEPLDLSDEKKPLDMTTDEAIEHLFGEETAQKLRETARGAEMPPSDNNGVEGE